MFQFIFRSSCCFYLLDVPPRRATRACLRVLLLTKHYVYLILCPILSYAIYCQLPWFESSCTYHLKQQMSAWLLRNMELCESRPDVRTLYLECGEFSKAGDRDKLASVSVTYWQAYPDFMSKFIHVCIVCTTGSLNVELPEISCLFMLTFSKSAMIMIYLPEAVSWSRVLYYVGWMLQGNLMFLLHDAIGLGGEYNGCSWFWFRYLWQPVAVLNFPS